MHRTGASSWKRTLNYDVNLRPRGFDEYVGQEQVKENLKVAIAAARGAQRGA